MAGKGRRHQPARTVTTAKEASPILAANRPASPSRRPPDLSLPLIAGDAAAALLYPVNPEGSPFRTRIQYVKDDVYTEASVQRVQVVKDDVYTEVPSEYTGWLARAKSAWRHHPVGPMY